MTKYYYWGPGTPILHCILQQIKLTTIFEHNTLEHFYSTFRYNNQGSYSGHRDAKVYFVKPD